MKPPPNLWPFGIVIAFALFFAGTIALVVLACSHKMDLVSPDYYEQEIRYANHLARLGRSQAATSIAFDVAAQQITVALSASAGPAPAGMIELYRPSAAALDRRLPLELDGRRIQNVDARGLLPGLWKVRVSWRAGGQDYFAEKSLIVGPS